MCGTPDEGDGTARTRDLDREIHAFLIADRFDDGRGAAARELEDFRGDAVIVRVERMRRAELARQFQALCVVTDRNHALRTHDLRRREDAAQSDRPVADDDDRSAACAVRAHDTVMTGRHHVGER